MKTILSRLTMLLVILLALVIIGAIGFMITEDLSFFDAIYFTVTTISTVGYGDLTPTTTAGKVLAIIIVILGVATFLAVVAEAAQLLLNRRQERLRAQRVEMLLGLFFSELGNDFLRLCTLFDPDIENLRQDTTVNDTIDSKFQELKTKLDVYPYNIEIEKADITRVKELIINKGEIAVRLLENPSLHAHESFTELLRAIFHLREELIVREDVTKLPKSDLNHLKGDFKRIYPLLAKHWVVYLKYLKDNYGYLYSFAVRTNPFNQKISAIVTD
jgi:hypothetical protein